ncbi:hypothetical protein BGZ80_009787 [Entomortierella chlamydospora]|uniref:Mis12-mtw1 family protein n=1 Tax=Entomortierella chlamydospora TaxID=101097 RepID=A0A9P6MVT3_9FUNG|nr:hypothetical protein BGZ79_002199 [Entomortierella chlamydospora]KAG0015551.1 hypothetical protein BGZ80_009787 [Entomortierella chlamydospora]
MPPRHAFKVNNAISKTTNTAGKSRKRKNADRSEDEHDSDFDYTQHRRLPQSQKQRSSKSAIRPNRLHQQQAVPSLSSSDSPSPPAPSRTFAEEQETWRTELSEMKRAKQYTEEDRGFVFTRKKITKTAIIPSTAIITTPKSGRTNHQFNDAANPLFSTPNPPLTPEGTPSKDRMYDRRGNPAKLPAAKQQQNFQQHQLIPQTPKRNQESIVAIPMRETPMIKRNKDMRNDASRRSSFTMRGKRASSIGNGFHATPHASVDPRCFFRHIAAEDPPPVRMKQLMAWCARKCIDSQQASSQSTLKIAKQIEEEALSMLIAGKFSVSWYSRPLDTEPIRAVPKKPHQQNVDNLRKLKECEAQIAKLQKEDEEWTRIISSFNTFHASLLDSGLNVPPGDEAIIFPESFTDNIDIELLTADERSLWEKHCKQKNLSSTPGSATRSSNGTDESANKPSKENNKWMSEMMGSLEKEVDNLRDTLYAASRFDKIAKQYTNQVLEQIATALDERQRPTEGLSLFATPTSSSSSSPSSSSSSSLALLGKGAQSLSISSTSKPISSTFVSAISLMAPGADSDSADDPRQILRALSRLSL